MLLSAYTDLILLVAGLTQPSTWPYSARPYSKVKVDMSVKVDYTHFQLIDCTILAIDDRLAVQFMYFLPYYVLHLFRLLIDSTQVFNHHASWYFY
jgi:hypothetical protein